MSQTFNQTLPKSKEVAYARKLEALLATIEGNIRATKEINRENDRLKKLNDKSFARLRKSIDALAAY